MNKVLKKSLCGFLISAFVLSAVYSSSLICFAASDTGSSAYMSYTSNIDDYSYNVDGIMNGSPVDTSYSDEGYVTYIKTSSTSAQPIDKLQNGVEKILDDINLGITQNLSLVDNGRYVKVQYVVRNTSNAAQTVSLASGADVQIGDDRNADKAPITEFADGSGFYMTGTNSQFNFIGKGNNEVTDVDAFWFGSYDTYDDDMSNIIFTQASGTSFSGDDSAMGYSWNNRTIAANSSQTFSVLLGVGAPNVPPALTLSTPSASFADSNIGSSVSFSGTVSDSDNTTGTEIYYQIDSLSPVKAYTFTGIPGVFTANITIPSDLSVGTHTIKLYAMDSAGGISKLVTKTINVLALSDACGITGVTTPSSTTIGTDSISANVPNTTESITADMSVSANATWKLYSDSACTNEITNKVMALSVGDNTAYIKVTAQSGTTKIYKFTVTRAAANTPTDNPVSSPVSNPKTGDTSAIPLSLAFFGAAAAVLLAVKAVKKRYN